MPSRCWQHQGRLAESVLGAGRHHRGSGQVPARPDQPQLALKDLPSRSLRRTDIGTGHFALETHADEIATAIRGFLTDCCDPANPTGLGAASRRGPGGGIRHKSPISDWKGGWQPVPTQNAATAPASLALAWLTAGALLGLLLPVPGRSRDRCIQRLLLAPDPEREPSPTILKRYPGPSDPAGHCFRQEEPSQRTPT